MNEAIRTYGTAKGYIQSAYLQVTNPLRLKLPNDTTLFLSFHLNAGFAAELYLKAFLYSTGHSEAELKSAAVRHDLEALLKIAEGDGFSDAGASALVNVLHKQHKSFEFRYMKADSSFTPNPLDQTFSAFSTLDTAVDTAVGASASFALTPGGAWALPLEFAAWRL